MRSAATYPAASPPDEVRDVEDASVDLVVTVRDRPVHSDHPAAWTHDALTETADAPVRMRRSGYRRRIRLGTRHTPGTAPDLSVLLPSLASTRLQACARAGADRASRRCLDDCSGQGVTGEHRSRWLRQRRRRHAPLSTQLARGLARSRHRATWFGNRCVRATPGSIVGARRRPPSAPERVPKIVKTHRPKLSAPRGGLEAPQKVAPV